MRAELYKVIKDKISSEAAFVEWVDLDRGQLDNGERELALSLPSVLIGFETIPYSEQASRGEQRGTVTVSITLVQENFKDSFEGSSEVDESLELLQNVDALYRILQGHRGTFFTALTRTSVEKTQYDQHLVIDTILFQTTVFDQTVKDRNLGKPTLNIDVTRPPQP